jgi:N-acetylneuraminic acid mutarotase
MMQLKWKLMSIVLNSVLVVVGLLGMAAIIKAESGMWTEKTSMPAPRWSLSTAVVNGKIYVIGGLTVNDALSTVEEYNPVTDTWTKKADMPTPRGGLSTAVVDGKIYAIGGRNCPGGIWSAARILSPSD